MQRPSSLQSRGTDKSKAKSRGIKKKYLAFSAALAPFMVSARSQAANTVYLYTPTATTTDVWSAGTDWSSTPLSSTTTELAFGTDFTFTNGFVSVNTDDNAGLFNLNALDLNGTGPTSGTASISINASTGSNLNFSGTTPIINLNATNGTGLTYVINAPINFASTLAMNAPSGTAAFNFAGPISSTTGGTGNLSITGSNVSGTAVTVNLSGTNTYSGITNLFTGNVSGAVLTVNVSGNESGTTGGWNIQPLAGNNVGVGITNFLAGSQIVVAAGKTFQLGDTGATGTTQTLNVAGTVSNAGQLNVQRTAVFNISSGGIWNQSGGMTVAAPDGGNSTFMNVSTGGLFTYNGSTPIVINPAPGHSGSATVTIAGTFNTSMGFTDAGSTNTGTGKLSLSGGTVNLASTSNIATLATTPLLVTLVSGTNSTINTGGSSGTNMIGSNINNSSTAAGSITKAGLGTLTLSGSDTYTGSTNISGGTLIISGSGSLPASSVIGFTNNATPATLDLTALTTQTIGGFAFGYQNGSAGTNTITVKGTTSTALTTSAALINFAPFNASGNLLFDMSSVGSFTYTNTSGNFNLSTGVNAGSGGGIVVKLAGQTDSITANALNVGVLGSQTTGIGTPSTLILGTNSTLDVGTINVGSTGSRATGYLNVGSGTLTIAGVSGGAANLNIGRADSNTTTDIETSIMDTSAGTLAATLGNVIIGQSSPTSNITAGRGVTINAGLNMGAGNLSASSVVIGQLNSGINQSGGFYTELVNGSFNITGGTATVPTITLGTSAYTGNFNSTAGLASIINATVTLNTGATLNTTSIAPGAIATYTAGTLTVNPVINWNDGSIVNIGGSGLTISGGSINLAGATANHALNISSGQVASISSTINGSTGVLNLIGAGTVNLLSTNTYAGSTNIIAGTLVPGAANTLSPNSGINISGGTLNTSSYINTIASLTEGSSGVLDLGIGNLLTVSGVANVTGILNLTGTAGTLPESLMNYSSGSTISFASETGIPSGDSLLVTPTSLELIVTGSGGPATLNWTNASGNATWDTASLNFNTPTGTTVAYSDTSNTTLSAGDIVAFTDNNNGNYNVSIPATVHPTSTTVNNSGGTYTFNGSGGIAGPGSLLKLGTGTLSLYVSDAYTGGTNISGGTLALYNAHALPAFGNVSIGSTAKLVADTVGNAYALQINGLSITSGGTIDLKNNAATIRGSSIGAVYTLVKSGFNSTTSTWTGTGITSSLAAGSSLNALGVIINDTGANTGTATNVPIYNTSSGASTVVAGDILVKYTYYGDANLDGKVDGSDYSLIDYAYTHGSLTGWYNGDFNYDGVVDGSDYTLIDNAFNSQGSQIADVVATPNAEIAGSSSVPEPTSLGLIALGAAGLLGRRRR